MEAVGWSRCQWVKKTHRLLLVDYGDEAHSEGEREKVKGKPIVKVLYLTLLNPPKNHHIHLVRSHAKTIVHKG